MEPEIVKADKTYRRKLLLCYAALVVVGVAAIGLGLPWFSRYLQSVHPAVALTISERAAIAFILIFVAPAAYLVHVGRMVLRHGCMPYPGMRVIRDTTVVRGAAAARRGRALVILGTAAIAMALLGALITHYRLQQLRHDPLYRGLLMVRPRSTGP